MRSDEQSVTNSGKLFHARGAATTKARSASVERRVAGITRADDDADRDVTSATARLLRDIFYGPRCITRSSSAVAVTADRTDS